jgi:PAS domain S-box-containing protein
MSILSHSQLTGLAQREIQQLLLYDALDAGPALVFVADDEMQFLAVNQTACEFLGYTREELLSRRVTDVVEDTDAAERYEAMRQARSAVGGAKLRTKDGRLISLSYHAGEVRVAGLPCYVSVGFAS